MRREYFARQTPDTPGRNAMTAVMETYSKAVPIA